MAQKILIAYATRYGATEKIAKKISEYIIGECTLVNIANDVVDVTLYDRVIIGTSVYAFRANSAFKKFIKKQKQALLSRPLAVYLCGIMGEDEPLSLDMKKNILGEELFDHAQLVKSMGGELNFNKMNFLEKSIASKVIDKFKNKGNPLPPKDENGIISTIIDEDICVFCEELNSKSS